MAKKIKVKLTPEQQARIDARRERLLDAAAAKKENQKAQAAEAKQEAIVKEAREKAAARRAADLQFQVNLRAGQLQTDIPKKDNQYLSGINTISTNSAYFDGLTSAIADLGARLINVKNNSIKNLEKKYEKAAKAKGQTLDTYTDEKGNRKVANISADLRNKLQGPEWALREANKHLGFAQAAHRLGDHLAAMDHFSKAADHVYSALGLSNNNFGTDIKKVFAGDNPGFENEEMGYKGDDSSFNRRLTTLVNGYTEHVTGLGINKGFLHPDLAGDIKNNFTRNYVSGPKNKNPKLAIKIPKFAKVKTRDEKDAEKKAAAEKAASPKYGDLNDNSIAIVAGESPTLAKIKQISETFQPGGDFEGRWKRQLIQKDFEKDEEENAQSAANAGVPYTKKTFIGSEAAANPDKYFAKLQLKHHWMNLTGGAAHEFEQTDAAIDPLGYASKNKLKLDVLENHKPYKTWAKATGMTGFVASFDEDRQAEREAEGLPEMVPVGMGLDTPLGVSLKQISRARSKGTPITKEEAELLLADTYVRHPETNKIVKFKDLEPKFKKSHLARLGAEYRIGDEKGDEKEEFNPGLIGEEDTQPVKPESRKTTEMYFQEPDLEEDKGMTTSEAANAFVEQEMINPRKKSFDEGRGAV